MDQSDLASLLAVVLSRAVERVLLIVVGGFAIYLGYKLFLVIPSADRGEGKIALPGGVSIFLTRIGPGVFFALFGAGVIGYSVTRPVKYSLPTNGTEPIVFSGFGQNNGGASREPSDPKTASLRIAGPDPEIVVARLNGLLANARRRLTAPAVDEIEPAVQSAKLAVMLAGWKPAWGDREAFARWANENGKGEPPSALAPGASVVFGTVLQ